MSFLDEVDRALLAIGRSGNRLTSEEMQRHEEVLSEFMAAEGEEDDPYVTDDDDDMDYVPIDDGEISDIDNELEVEEEIPENEDIDEAGCDEGIEQEPNASNPVSGVPGLLGEKEQYYECKIDNMFWKKEQPAARARHWNRFTSSSTRPVGPAHRFLPNPVYIFREIMSPEIVDIIVRETNRKAGEVIKAWNEANPTCQPKEWKPTDEVEMYAWFGLLLFSGVFHCSNMQAKDLWHSRHFDIYNATMSLDRFKMLLRFVRFDGANTRSARMLLSKSAPIDDIWTMMNHNLQEAYTPNAAITVDEQLFPYRGRTRFTQYIPSKPAKYGIKIWWVCDSSTNYPLKGQIYTGKRPTEEREINQGERVVLDLVEKYRNSGRTVYCDNFFTSLELAKTLMQKGLAIVGTVRANRKFVPLCFPLNRKTRPYKKFRPLYQTLFAFLDENVSMLSYVAKVDKYVLVLSTQHYTRVTEASHKYKPAAILDYNENKSGVDTMDKMLSGYSCKRATNRWPLAIFYNMLDVTGLASYIIYKHLRPSTKSDQRRDFLLELAEQLTIPNMERRAANPMVYGRPAIKAAMQKFNVFYVSIPYSQVHTEI